MRMMEHFPSGFLWGLPVSVFDIALLWQPDEDLVRRRPRLSGAARLPSWSWVGWQGQLESDSWNSEYDLELTQITDDSYTPNASTVPKITPVCQWEFEDHGQVHAIKSDFAKRGVTHASDLIRNPSPILTARGPTVRCNVSNDHCSGTRNWYSIYTSGEGRKLRCGMIMLSPSLALKARDTDCELLALSRGVSRGWHLWDSMLITYPFSSEERKEQGLFSYYNVLWIERRKGIAYRKALGMISVEAWDTLNPQLVDIKLG
jgi:hypothetical protein